GAVPEEEQEMKTRILVVALLALAVACSEKKENGPQATPSSTPDATSTGADIHEYKLEGQVVSVNKDAKSAVISHKTIEGFMAAMTMSFPVPDQNDLDRMQPGENITATVYQDPSNHRFWLGKVKVEVK